MKTLTARLLLILACSLLVACQASRPASMAPPATNPDLAGPDANVPVNVFIGSSPGATTGQYIELFVRLNEEVTPAHGTQLLKIESTYYPADSADTADDVWATPPPTDVQQILAGNDSWRARVQVDDYNGHGVMVLSACTLGSNLQCADGRKKFYAIEINPD